MPTKKLQQKVITTTEITKISDKPAPMCAKDYQDLAYEFKSLKHAIKGTGWFSKPEGF